MRYRYLEAMGITVWQARQPAPAPEPAATEAPREDLWVLRYPGCLLILSQAPDASDLRRDFQLLADDLAVALGGDYRKPRIAIQRITADTDARDGLRGLVREWLALRPPPACILLLGPAAGSELIGGFDQPWLAADFEGTRLLAIPAMEALRDSAQLKRETWRFLAGHRQALQAP